jgi:hypothetical protein
MNQMKTIMLIMHHSTRKCKIFNLINYAWKYFCICYSVCDSFQTIRAYMNATVGLADYKKAFKSMLEFNKSLGLQVSDLSIIESNNLIKFFSNKKYSNFSTYFVKI